MQETNLNDIEEIKHWQSNLDNGQMIVLQNEEAMRSIYEMGEAKELRDIFRENSTSEGANIFTLNLEL